MPLVVALETHRCPMRKAIHPEVVRHLRLEEKAGQLDFGAGQAYRRAADRRHGQRGIDEMPLRGRCQAHAGPETGQLIDEYQSVEGLWEAVRGRIDDAQTKGLFLLTGSSSPDDALVLQTGARRIAPIRLSTMTFHERGLSSGAMSLGSLLESHPLGVVTDRISVTEAVDAIVVGGWPTNVGLSTSQALEARDAKKSCVPFSPSHHGRPPA